MNFKNFGNDPSDATPPGAFPLARQSSVYSLTFDEFQRGGSIGKDFGSMNMDELLKNIWSVEESQQILGSTSALSPCGTPGNYPQLQGSIVLPQTLGQKTVDEVWKDSNEKTNLPPRQLTLGEVTLEEFLFRAGVVKIPEKPPQNFDLLGDLNHPISNPPAGFEYQKMGNQVFESNNQINNLNKQSPQIFPKQPAMAYANPMHVSNNSCIGGHGIGIMGNTDPIMNGNLGMIGNGVAISSSSPNMESQSISPTPYVFTGLKARRGNNGVEKVIERRHRRMIKNRESAARSRARKQAYTMELEAEIANLKEEYQELQKKQARLIEIQKNKIFETKNITFETKNVQQGGKRRRLKRTQTGPW